MSQAVPASSPAAPDAVTPHDAEAARQRTGLLYGISAYTWWGFVSLYFKAMAYVPATVMVAHRIIWSMLLLGTLICVWRQWAAARALVERPRVWAALAVSTLLLATNWLVFVYAVATNRIVESSLGYFLIPLLTVVLGMVFLGERLRWPQAVAVTLAAAGITYLTIARGGLPWIAIALACSFGTYGLIRRRTPVDPLIGLFVETAMLSPAAVIFLAWTYSHPAPPEMTSPGTLGLLALSGVVTAVPLLWFIAAVKRLRFVTLSFVQYINPSMQLVMAVALFGEPFGRERVVAFVLIWAAIGVFVVDSVRRARSERPSPAGVE